MRDSSESSISDKEINKIKVLNTKRPEKNFYDNVSSLDNSLFLVGEASQVARRGSSMQSFASQPMSRTIFSRSELLRQQREEQKVNDELAIKNKVYVSRPLKLIHSARLDKDRVKIAASVDTDATKLHTEVIGNPKKLLKSGILRSTMASSGPAEEQLKIVWVFMIGLVLI